MRHPAYYGLKAIVYSGLGKYNDSYSVYEEALDDYPEYKGLWMGRLDLMISTKKYKKAGVYINSLVDKYPNDNDLWFFEIKFIFLQISVYSRTIAEEIVSVVNKSV
jgi:tetratricopeptide (TPR) repeat protein